MISYYKLYFLVNIILDHTWTEPHPWKCGWHWAYLIWLSCGKHTERKGMWLCQGTECSDQPNVKPALNINPTQHYKRPWNIILLLWAMRPYMNRHVSSKVGKVWVISHDRFLSQSVLVSLVWSEQASIKMWRDLLCCFLIMPGTVNQILSNHTHTVLIKQIISENETLIPKNAVFINVL